MKQKIYTFLKNATNFIKLLYDKIELGETSLDLLLSNLII